MSLNVSWEYIGEELAVFWENPYGHGKEKIASFWWPFHPPEATAEVEFYFEVIAEAMVRGIKLTENNPIVSSLQKERDKLRSQLAETRGIAGDLATWIEKRGLHGRNCTLGNCVCGKESLLAKAKAAGILSIL